jgi:hypothetical protein
VVNELLKFRYGCVAVVEHEIGFPTQVSGAQPYCEVLWHAKFDRARRLQQFDCPVRVFALQGDPCPDGRQPMPLNQRAQREGLIEFGRMEEIS